MISFVLGKNFSFADANAFYRCRLNITESQWLIIAIHCSEYRKLTCCWTQTSYVSVDYSVKTLQKFLPNNALYISVTILIGLTV